jgi:hypothetical protein
MHLNVMDGVFIGADELRGHGEHCPLDWIRFDQMTSPWNILNQKSVKNSRK